MAEIRDRRPGSPHQRIDRVALQRTFRRSGLRARQIVLTHTGSTAAAVTGIDRRRSRLFAHIGFLLCIILQRFGLVIGDSALFASLPLFLLLLVWALLTGIGRLTERGLLAYIGFTSWALIATIAALLWPDARFGLSLPSLGALLVTYALAVVGPSDRFDRNVLFDVFLFYVRLCSVLGIVQFLIQFVGIKLFAFITILPPLKAISVESQYNFYPLLHYGSRILRSNGFFLLEPSIWSQVLALAIVVDYFLLGRLRYLPLYVLAYLVTFSGTGALSLVLALPFFAGLSARNFGRIAALLVAAVIALAIASVAIPQQIGSLLARTQELSYSGSSGYARFIGPFLPISEFSQEPRFLLGYGPGATERYIHFVKGTGNSIAKLLTDYGVIGFLAFTAMLFALLWRRDVAMLSILGIVTFFVGGGYLVFAPMLVLLFLLCIWSSAEAPAIRQQA